MPCLLKLKQVSHCAKEVLDNHCTVTARYTFTTFSHMKSILVRDFSKLGEYLGETR